MTKQPRAPRESGFFADYHQVRIAASELRTIDRFQPDQSARWLRMSNSERLEALQEVENRMARLQGRPAEKVYGVWQEPESYGAYVPSGPRRGIYVNLHEQQIVLRAEALNTVVHEGRHAYQKHAVEVENFHPQRPELDGQDDVSAWKQNQKQYKTMQKHGSEAYMRQPLERDAGGFAVAVTKGLYPDYEPRPNRIDQFNARKAEAKYGMLKPHLEATPASEPHRIDRRSVEKTAVHFKADQKARKKQIEKDALAYAKAKTEWIRADEASFSGSEAEKRMLKMYAQEYRKKQAKGTLSRKAQGKRQRRSGPKLKM